MQLQPKRTDNLEDRIKARISLPGEGFVQALAGQTGVTGNLRHSLGAGNVPKRLGNKRGISVSFFKACFQISGHLRRSPQMLGNVIAASSNFLHSNYSERLRARRRAVLMSLVCVRLSPPARRMTNARPRCLKYTR